MIKDIYKYNDYICKNENNTDKLKKEIIDWLYEFAPTHFISIQLPTEQRTNNLEISIKYLKSIMKYFQKQLSPRRWNKKHLVFIVFCENNAFDWHFHIFLKNDRYSDLQLENTINKTNKKFNFSESVINIEPITKSPDKVYSYGVKAIFADSINKFDSFRIFLSTDIFNIPY